MPRPRHSERKRKKDEYAAQPKHDREQSGQDGQMQQDQEEELGPAQWWRNLNERGFLENRFPRRLFDQPALEPLAQRVPESPETAEHFFFGSGIRERVLETPGHVEGGEGIDPGTGRRPTARR
jgi:hypothetical protein